jgi:hypothetical protein
MKEFIDLGVLPVMIQLAIAFVVSYVFVLMVMGPVINKRVSKQWIYASFSNKLDIIMFWHVLLISMMSVIIHNVLVFAGV